MDEAPGSPIGARRWGQDAPQTLLPTSEPVRGTVDKDSGDVWDSGQPEGWRDRGLEALVSGIKQQ